MSYHLGDYNMLIINPKTSTVGGENTKRTNQKTNVPLTKNK